MWLAESGLPLFRAHCPHWYCIHRHDVFPFEARASSLWQSRRDSHVALELHVVLLVADGRIAP